MQIDLTNKKTMIAEASEIQSSGIYMTIKSPLLTTPEPNLNGVICTESFIDEIIENQSNYVGIPLCADIVTLVDGRHDLGHCYDEETGKFSTSIIGSFYKFEKELLRNGNIALIGYARIPKRNPEVCAAVCNLFAENNLKLSFEISCGSYKTNDDGLIVIDRAEENFLDGMCLVTHPACQEAIATTLVAEENNDEDKDGKEADDQMPNENIENVTEPIVEEEIGQEEIIAEQTQDETVEQVAEDLNKEEIVAETNESAECKQNEDPEEEDEIEEDQDREENAACGKKKCAEDLYAERIEKLEQAINSLAEKFDSMHEEFIASKQIIAEDNNAGEKINPFTASISLPDESKKYSLLERDSNGKFEHYSILDSYK